MAKTKGHWIFDGVKIAGYWIDDPVAPDGRRFEATRYGYAQLRKAKCRQAVSKCEVDAPGCYERATLEMGEIHHTGKHGRGSGGSWRDDRNTVWCCRHCHSIEEKKRTGPRWSAKP